MTSLKNQVQIINNTTDSNLTAGLLIQNRQAPFSFEIGDSVIIKGNKVLSPNRGKGGAIYLITGTKGVPRGITTLKLGKMLFEGNEAMQGGAIYCEDSSITIELNGTVFKNNKAKIGGAIYTEGSLVVNGAVFENNSADTASSIFINSDMSDTAVSPFVSIKQSRFYNAAKAANAQDHIYATYHPLTAFPPSMALNGNWWGKSDTIGVMRDWPKGYFPINNWAKAYWSLKGGMPVLPSDTSFPLEAALKYNSGSLFPANSFSSLKGVFTTDTGSFSPDTAAISSSNLISSTYHTFKDSSVKSRNANIIAWIDADTFKKVQVVWSVDTLKDTSTAIALKQVEQLQVALYPIPTHNIVHIEPLPIGTKIYLYNSSGLLVLEALSQEAKTSLNLQHLAAGTYSIKLISPLGLVGTAQVVKR